MMDTVKFYSTNDLSCGHNLEMALARIEALNPKGKLYTINQILEFYNISLFIDAGLYLKSWDKEARQRFAASKGPTKRIVGVYFGDIERSNFARRTANIAWMYQDDFLKLFEIHQLSQRISERQFVNMVRRNEMCLNQLLASKHIVDTYSDHLKKRVLSSPINAETLAEAYFIKRTYGGVRIYIPSNISNDEKASLIERYVDSDSPNYNYLIHIGNARDAKDKMKIDARIRLKVKQRIQALRDQMLAESNGGMRLKFRVGVEMDQAEPVVEKYTAQLIQRTLSAEYLKSDMGGSAIFKNIVELFDYVDSSMRIQLISKRSELTIFEGIGLGGADEYKTGFSFGIKRTIADLQLEGYRKFLENHGERLEKVIEWIYGSYLPREFGLKGFEVQMPAKYTKQIDKCKSAVAELESIARQYSLYVKNGHIDHELLELSSESVDYSTTPSLCETKQVYINVGSIDVLRMVHNMFSDQSTLSYRSRQLHEETLLRLLMRHKKIEYAGFRDSERMEISHLIEHELLRKQGGFVTMGNRIRIGILFDLYQNEFAVYPRFDDETQKEVDKMLGLDYIASGKSLLSDQEADYFNYYLNTKRFTNGPKLRNGYSHGSIRGDSNTHERNYVVMLKLLILMTIKIYDDLWCARGYKTS